MDDYTGDSIQLVNCQVCKKLTDARLPNCEFCDADLTEIPPPLARPTSSKPQNAGKQTSSFQVQKCRRCGEINRIGVVYCDNCGANLKTGKDASLPTRDIGRESEADSTLSYDESELSREKLWGEGVRASTRGTTMFQEDMLVRIDVDSHPTPLLVEPKLGQKLYFGRRGTVDTEELPAIDLTDYGGYNFGVSRRHGVIRLEGNRIIYTDLASSNGTFINGLRVTPHEDYTLRDGDVVRLGRMKLQIYFDRRRS